MSTEQFYSSGFRVPSSEFVFRVRVRVRSSRFEVRGSRLVFAVSHVRVRATPQNIDPEPGTMNTNPEQEP